MNLINTKTVLYAYNNVGAVMEQIDDFVERKAFSSMTDYSPCIEQCEKILNYTAQKIALIELKNFADKVILKLNDYERDCLDYKYFKKKPKEHYIGFDYESRTYFRRQVKLVQKIAKAFERVGLNDDWFEKNCLTNNFFRELKRRVIKQEILSNKNKKVNKDKKPERLALKIPA